MKLLNWIKSLFQNIEDENCDNDFNRKAVLLEECAYFIRGYKCSLDCEECPYCDEDSSFNNYKASKLCEWYKKYHKVPAEMSPEELKWYESLTKKQRETYLKVNKT